jgi:hypothetical protein
MGMVVGMAAFGIAGALYYLARWAGVLPMLGLAWAGGSYISWKLLEKDGGISERKF